MRSLSTKHRNYPKYFLNRFFNNKQYFFPIVVNLNFIFRLLGPAARDIPVSASQALASVFHGARVVIMDNGLGIFTNSKEQIDFVVSFNKNSYPLINNNFYCY